MDAIKRFDWFNERMRKDGKPIPNRVLRDYLDTLQLAKETRPGLHNVTITVTKVPATGLLNWDLMLESGTSIRVEGQKYREWAI